MSVKNRHQTARISRLTLLTAGALALAPSSAVRAAFADETPAKYTGLPYNGKPIELPGVIQAEEYDIAPDAVNGISFNYNGNIAKNDIRKSGDSIGLARFGNDHVSIKGEPLKAGQAYVGWTQDGEWLKYSVHFAEGGRYLIGGQFAAGGKDATVSFTFTPDVKTGPVSVPTTAGYQPDHEVYHVWAKHEKLTTVSIAKGDYVLMVKILKAGGMNMDYFTFTKDERPDS